MVLLERGRAAEALDHAQQAWVRQQRDDIRPGLRAGSAFVLARALWSTHSSADDRTRARSLAERALATYGEEDGESIREVEAWLEAHGVGG